MTIILKNKETLQFKKFYFKCKIGKKGLKGDLDQNFHLDKERI